jgi:preprotein translocase subunit SecD
MHIVLEVDTSKVQPQDASDAVERALEIIRNRVDEFGVAEPSIQRQGKRRIIVQLPGIKEPERAINLIGKTAMLEFKLVDEDGDLEKALEGEVPDGSEILYDREGNPYLLKKEVLLTGASLRDARVSFGEFGEPEVAFELNQEGAKKFEQITSQHIGERLAIILDGRVQSAPTIQTRISDRGRITGRFSLEEAKDLAIVLRAGALPAPIKIVENRIVGPSLGEDSIRKGVIAAIIGAALVIGFMIAYYKISGVIADLAFLFNFIIIMGALAFLDATLTLPGIAGIILTIGMSVDANVIVFERIKEELRIGKTIRRAIEGGYKNAFRTILDANLTTLITAAVLFYFGTGPIKGFAVTLSIGILASLFTSLFVSRIMFELLTTYQKITKLSI